MVAAAAGLAIESRIMGAVHARPPTTALRLISSRRESPPFVIPVFSTARPPHEPRHGVHALGKSAGLTTRSPRSSVTAMLRIGGQRSNATLIAVTARDG